MKRPFGVTVLAIWSFLGAYCILAFAVVLLGLPMLFSSLRLELAVIVPASVLSFLFGVFAYCCAKGLWRLKNWARIVTIAFNLIFVIVGNQRHPVSSRIIPTVVVLYLLTAGAKRAFGRTAQA